MINRGYDSESRFCLAIKELKNIDYDDDKMELIDLLYPKWIEAGKNGHFEFFVREIGRMIKREELSLCDLKYKSYEELSMMI